MLKNQSHFDTTTQIAISVVIPSYNERATLHDLYLRLNATLKTITRDYEFLFIDDGSNDGSIDVLRELNQMDDTVRYIRFRRNFGKSAALAVGFRAARFP